MLIRIKTLCWLMDYKVDKKEIHNKEKYVQKDKDIAYEFSKEAYKEFGTFLKAIVLFGSQAKNENKKESDIDILLVVDDVSITLSPEIIETYKLINERLVQKISRKLHVTTLRFSSFWDLVRNGDPVIINMLRDGVPLVDSNFFEPLQVLLRQGKIKPTQESIWTYFSRAPSTLHNSKWHVLQGVINLYWAVMDAAQAVLMTFGEVPPSPDHVADLLQVRLVNEGKLKKKHAVVMKEFYDLYKGIVHRNIKEVSGTQYDAYYKKADEFIKEMQKFIK